MAVETKKCYLSNMSKIILFDLYSSDDDLNPSDWVRIFAAVMATIFGILGVLGNSLTITVILRDVLMNLVLQY